MAHKKHAKLIRAWLDGAVVEAHDPHTGWEITYNPAFDAGIEYRVKPAEPEKTYPETQMTGSMLDEYYENSPYIAGESSHEAALVFLVNRALRHACDAGQIVTREEFDRAVGDRKARDLAVAYAVNAEVRRHGSDLSPMALKIIIKGVKP